jgi:ATP-dependent helicase/nuclease subunit A
VLAQAIAWEQEHALRRACGALADLGSAKVAEKALRLLDWLALAAEQRAEAWHLWRGEFLLEDGAPRGPGALFNPNLAKTRPELVEVILAEQTRVLGIEDTRRACRTAAVSAALAALAAPVAQAYDGRKERAALLDYDDLISRSSRLLVDPGAAWVLYKLDGGLDHLLLDEVQDTAPAQWAIAGALTAEFFAGEGAREGRRTVFAVGDRKQSIYSFQGADPGQFDVWRQRFGSQVRQAGETWHEVPLNVSFRSTPPVLELVDAVFAEPIAAAGVVDGGQTLAHVSDRRAGGAVAADAGARPGAAGAVAGALGQPAGARRGAAAGGRAGTVDRRRNRRRGAAGEPRPGTAARRRAGAGASPQRLRARAGAGAEGPLRAGGGPGPAGADRAAGGRRSAGARRYAVAAA